MEQSDTTKTGQKPLSVLERFRQLSRQKDQQAEITDVEAGGDVSTMILTPERINSKPCNKKEGELLIKDVVFNNRGRGFRGRGGKRSFDHDKKPMHSRVNMMHQGILESELGITEYISPGCLGFKGIIKQRFSDFQVNEIDLAGNIIRLTNTDIPVEKDELPVIENMLSILTQEQWDAIEEMYNTKNEETPVFIEVTNVNKEMRTKIHKAVKVKFGVHIYSNTVDKDGKKFLQIGLAKTLDTRMMWPRSRGEYLHFVVHKENTDSTETVHTLAQYLNGLCHHITDRKPLHICNKGRYMDAIEEFEIYKAYIKTLLVKKLSYQKNSDYTD